MKKLSFLFVFGVAAAAFIFAACDQGTGEVIQGDYKVRPVVFVHGLAGSGDQFESQALRFASNGYPDHYFEALDHNSLVQLDRIAQLDAMIDKVLLETGADKVDLAGHSMGTSISQNYLSRQSRAAKIAHYVNIDGTGASELPGGVPTLNIMATSIAETIQNAKNVQLINNTHVQSASSPEVFKEMYQFFTGEAPQTTDILPSSASTITLRGKVIIFISNAIPEGSLDIFEVDPATGQRVNETPVYSTPLPEDGIFNFPNAKQGAAYEFRGTLVDEPDQAHWYYEPFKRTDRLIRLKMVEPGSALYNLLDTTEDTSAVIIVRNREMQGDPESVTGMDSVKINGTEICEEILPGGTGISDSGPMGLVVFDENADGVSDLTTVTSAYEALPFINGVDLVMPASPLEDGLISIVTKDRYSHKTQTINIPNRGSIIHKTFVQFLPL